MVPILRRKFGGTRASARDPAQANSQGPATLLEGAAELVRQTPVGETWTVDLRLRMRWRRTPRVSRAGTSSRPPSRGSVSFESSIRRRWERWRDLTRAQLVKTHGRLIHVFVASADLGRAWHAHGAWSDATDSDEAGFYARGVPVSKPGRLRVLASFVIDGDALRICVSESSVHAHPSSARTLVLASTETALDVGAPTPFPNLPWDVSSAKKFAKAPFTDDGELKQEFRTTRDDVPACRAAGDVDVTLEALSASQYHHASRRPRGAPAV